VVVTEAKCNKKARFTGLSGHFWFLVVNEIGGGGGN
jgi:hypothetical protein